MHPDLSNMGEPLPFEAVSLALILFLSILKDFIDDNKRKVSDRKENSR